MQAKDDCAISAYSKKITWLFLVKQLCFRQSWNRRPRCWFNWPIILPGEQGTIEDAFAAMCEESRRHGLHGDAYRAVKQAIPEIVSSLSAVVSLVLYMCSQAADYSGEKPARPRYKKTRKGLRYFPPNSPHVWDVGVRIGAALRSAFAKAESTGRTGEGGRAKPRGHIRRAHWHSYWVGPSWILPLAINIENCDELPAVIHKVE